jgi:hypothetical protein
MKRIKSVLVAASMVLATFAIGAAAQSILIKPEQKDITNPVIQNTNFDVEITFWVFEGEGCACQPIIGAYINATGSEGADYNITDEDGKCVLNLVVFGEYKVTIEAENYHTVAFNFDVVDQQTFKFHVGEVINNDSQNIPQVQQIIQTFSQFLRIREGKNNVVI